MIRYIQIRPTVLSLLLAISVLAPTLSAATTKNATASQSPEATVHALGNTLVDREHLRIFSANPAGRASAHALPDGKLLWQSTEIAVPVYADGNSVYATGTAKGPGLGQLLVLDASTGAIRKRLDLVFPQTVFPNPLAGPARELKFHAEAQSDAVILYWQYRSQALKGALEQDDSEFTELSGAFKLTQNSAAETSVQTATADFVAQKPNELIGDERIAGQIGRQFQSADAAVVSVSQGLSDNTFGMRYQWQLVERNNGETLGALSLPVSSAPFLVADALVFLELPAMAYVANGKVESVGQHLQAIRLSDQKVLFRIELLAPTYRGPMPP